MPYIKQERREEVGFPVPEAHTAGELNYQLTLVCNAYMQRGHKSYQEINDIMGALSSAQAEFYRRVAVPYEDLKIEENGDVYSEKNN